MLEVNTACRASTLPTTSNLKGIGMRITTANKIIRLYSKLPQHWLLTYFLQKNTAISAATLVRLHE